MRAGARIAVGVALGLAVVFGAAPPALADSAPDLAATAAFDHTTYHLGDAVTVTVHVKNKGDAPATNVTLDKTASGFHIDSTSATIASIAANGSDDFTITGTVTQAGVDAGAVVLNATVGETEADANPDDNSASATETVVAPTSDVSGTFFDFADSTHGVGGAKIKLINHADNAKTFSATSDATGAYTIADVPNGFYDIVVTAPDGWATHGDPQQATSVPTDGSLDFALDQVAAPITTTTTVGSPTTTTGHAAPILANTGTPIRWIAGGGAAVAAGGVVLLLLARRRRETSQVSETPSP